MGGDDATVGFTIAAAMAVIFVISPVLGMVSDQVGRRMLFLRFFTLIAIVSTLLIGTIGMTFSLALFAVGVVAIHTADVFYNTLLEDISSRSNIGTVAGVGIGLGYFGAIAAVIIAIIFTESLGHVFVMRVLGVGMLILTAPLLVIGRDSPARIKQSTAGLSALVMSTVRNLYRAAKRVREQPSWARFLIARFWYMWAVNAASAFAVLYGVQTVGLSEREVQLILLIGIVAAIPSGVIWGKMVDKLGALRVLKIAVSGWSILLLTAFAIPAMGLPPTLWGLVGVLSGVLIAGLYVAERPFIIGLAPEGRTGEYFGLNSMAGRLAAIAAPFSWGFISVTLNMGQLAAVIWLTGCAVISIVLLWGVTQLDRRGSD